MGLGTEIGLRNIVEDLTPQLGGALDVAGQSIVTTANGNVVIAPNGSGVVTISSHVVIDSDSSKLYFGAGQNASIYHNGSEMHFNSREAGFGNFYWDGGNIIIPAQNIYLKTDDRYYYSGATDDYSIGWNGSDAVHTITAGQFRFVGGKVELEEALSLLEKSADPAEPVEGECIIWISDGTQKGDDGDVLIASKAGGVTKWTTLFDHSAGAGW